jgi:hypothetical protein
MTNSEFELDASGAVNLVDSLMNDITGAKPAPGLETASLPAPGSRRADHISAVGLSSRC